MPIHRCRASPDRSRRARRRHFDSRKARLHDPLQDALIRPRDRVGHDSIARAAPPAIPRPCRYRAGARKRKRNQKLGEKPAMKLQIEYKRSEMHQGACTPPDGRRQRRRRSTLRGTNAGVPQSVSDERHRSRPGERTVPCGEPPDQCGPGAGGCKGDAGRFDHRFSADHGARSPQGVRGVSLIAALTAVSTRDPGRMPRLVGAWPSGWLARRVGR